MNRLPSTKSTLHAKGVTITMEQERIGVDTLGHSYIDPEWSFTDAAGHVHRDDTTLTRVEVNIGWCESCRDEHGDIELRCSICEEVIEPKYLWTGPTHDEIPGLVDWTIETRDGVWRLLPEDIEHIRGGEFPSDEWIKKVTSREETRLTYIFQNGG